MNEAATKTRSLDRAIDVLELLASQGPCALHEVQRLTSLPKSTAKRLLEALARRNLVRQGLSDGRYRINVTIPHPGDATHVSRVARLVKAAVSPMVQLTRDIGWPADLHVFHHGRMQIVETTHALSPFGQGKPHIYDIELNVFAAASGVAYLSTLPDAHISRLIETLRSDERFSIQRYRISVTRLFKEIERAREIGFARRLVGQTSALDFNAVATPIRSGNKWVGAISVWWPKTYCSAPTFLKMHSVQISRAARRISEA